MFTSHVGSTSPSIQYLFAAFYTLTFYNTTEVVILIFITFKCYSGCYFWSFFVTACGLIISTIGNVIYFYKDTPGQIASVSLAVLGWCCFINGQSIVLWSRLHIIVQNRRALLAILIMIIFNAITLSPPTIVLAVLGNEPGSQSIATKAYRMWEDIQLAMFSAQEMVISAIYMVQVFRLLTIFTNGAKRNIIHQLLAINAIIIAMDAILLGVQFSGNRDVQIPLKGLVYALKLKIEFAVLGRLVTIATGTIDILCFLSHHLSPCNYHER
ncbi:hypothetical protein BJY01DRAFT_237824 [Aspergillus pseudoustus]|uniref:DUF7703 domain-containing protein n=1 Tax=Aspergillus pseudoustus TaxID=1810923 RepID=A0ABR4JC07_9EURO